MTKIFGEYGDEMSIVMNVVMNMAMTIAMRCGIRDKESGGSGLDGRDSMITTIWNRNN